MSDEQLLSDYAGFVTAVTSDDSLNIDDFIQRLDALDEMGVFNVPLLLTASIGMASEAGEFSEDVKKFFFHRKQPSAERLAEMEKELGDILWYWVNACNAFGISPVDVIKANIEKLSKRYPGGFDAFRSNNKEDLGV